MKLTKKLALTIVRDADWRKWTFVNSEGYHQEILTATYKGIEATLSEDSTILYYGGEEYDVGGEDDYEAHIFHRFTTCGAF